jgi:hypothetical protein
MLVRCTRTVEITAVCHNICSPLLTPSDVAAGEGGTQHDKMVRDGRLYRPYDSL